MRRTRCAGASVAALAALAAAALEAAPAAAAPPARVNANGNPFTGGLGFDPALVTVSTGRVVEWTNTDFIAPHTATDDHGLWELSGNYGIPGVSTGFGPGDRVSRAFDAGRFPYFCAVHGRETMHGVVKARPRVRLVEVADETRRRVTWGTGDLPAGQVYDVQERVGGAWQTVRAGIRNGGDLFGADDGPFRARVRVAGDSAAHSGWSPPSR